MTTGRNGIRQSEKYPWYWEFRGKPVLLVGGSDEDNPFQWLAEQLEGQLDLLASVGGNYIRNTMSDRDADNLRAYQRSGDRYALDRWNGEYWDRFRFFLEETDKRAIVISLTLWDQHDFTGKQWEAHPFNPKLNQIGLDESGVYKPRDFFNAVRDRNALVLPYQQKFVEKILSISLDFDHVLYNITNEGWAGIEWERYWAGQIHAQAKSRGMKVPVTNMLHGPEMSVETVLEYPGIFTFVEISQNNNASTGYNDRDHWRHLVKWQEQIATAIGPRPFNNEKIYGAGRPMSDSMGMADHALRKFWRSVFAGCASVRFHRPDSGLGLSELAQKNIKAMRAFTEAFDLFGSRPDVSFAPADGFEGYCLRNGSGQCAYYLPDGGWLPADIGGEAGITWIAASGIGDIVASGGERNAPDDGAWVAVCG